MKNYIAIAIALVLIIGAVVYRMSDSSSSSQLRVLSQQELKEADGKDEQLCWLAVDGTVYEIEQGYKWVEGEHTESSRAYCGADMSNVIDSAPHGRTKLSQLKKVGTLAQ